MIIHSCLSGLLRRSSGLRPPMRCWPNCGCRWPSRAVPVGATFSVWFGNDSLKYFQFWNDSLGFTFDSGTHVTNIFNFGTAVSDLLSILERQSQIYWIWNDSLGFNFNSGTPVSNIFNFGTAVLDLISILERQSRIFWIWIGSLGFNFNSGTPVSNILDLERQSWI